MVLCVAAAGLCLQAGRAQHFGLGAIEVEASLGDAREAPVSVANDLADLGSAAVGYQLAEPIDQLLVIEQQPQVGVVREVQVIPTLLWIGHVDEGLEV